MDRSSMSDHRQSVRVSPEAGKLVKQQQHSFNERPVKPANFHQKILNGFNLTTNNFTTTSSPAELRDAMRYTYSNSYDHACESTSNSSGASSDVHDCRQKIYNQFKRSTSYGCIGKTIATSKSNFKQFSLSNQDYNISSYNNNLNQYVRRDPARSQDPENPKGNGDNDSHINVSDIIGSFGLFQAIVLLFSGIREGLVGYDALVMSIILQPGANCKWPLVCGDYWLRLVIESAYFLGLVTGNLTWGYCADKFGRRPAYLVAHTMSILFGSLAIFMPSIYLFAVCRFLTAFGCIGYNIIYSIQVELIGIRHRSFSTILNHLGWGLGVICVPLVDHLIDDYRTILSIAPILSLAMLPWAFWLPESSRWLMANGKFERARKELIRAAKFNGRQITSTIEKSIWVLEQRVRSYKLAQEQLPGKTKNAYKLIFTDPRLLRDTFILSYLAFVGHLFYYVQTLNFANVKNLSTEANFITSGAGEWSLVDSDLIPALDTVLIITTNNGLGTLSSLLLIFIALIVNQEVYPTILRQTGTSLIGSIGESGSLLAPLLIYISNVVGPEKTNATFTFFCVFGIFAAQFLTKTDDIELPDT